MFGMRRREFVAFLGGAVAWPLAARRSAAGLGLPQRMATDPSGGSNMPPSPPIVGGWTVFTATEPSGEGVAFNDVGTRKVYVSATGVDANPGTQAQPKKTIAAGVAALRSGKPDWLLFKKGDVWTDENFSSFAKAGPSSAQPMLISSYGTGARPMFRIATRSGSGFDTFAGNPDNLAIVGLEFYAYQRNPADPGYIAATNNIYVAGIRWLALFNWLLIEDMKISFFSNNVTVQNNVIANQNLFLRRCVITDSYLIKTVGHSIGCYVDYLLNPVFEECVFDHNGWNENIPGMDTDHVFNRNLYIQFTCAPATVKRNIFGNSASSGMQLRSGGTMQDNFLTWNFYGFDVGHHTGSEGAPQITTALVQRNVSVDNRNNRGISVQNAATSGVVVSNNIFRGMSADLGAELDPNTNGVIFSNNILFITGVDGLVDSGVNNLKTNNNIDKGGTNKNPGGTAPAEPFLDPARNAGTYYGSIGGSPATPDGFLAAARLQSKDNWNDLLGAKAVNNHIRAGFNFGPV